MGESKDLEAFLGTSAWQHSADDFSYSCDLLLLRNKESSCVAFRKVILSCIGFVCCFVLFGMFYFKFSSDRIFPLIVSPKDRKEHYKDMWRNGVEFGELENADTASDLAGL